MKPKGRYNIKLAEKKGVVVKESEDVSSFYELLLDTSSRDGFFINTKNYYESMLNTLSQAKLLCAYYDEKLIGAGIFTFTKNQGLYYYGASSNEYRNLMATYLLQWRAIQMAKEKNCRFYDFLGISAPDAKNDRLEGVTEFKLKFGEI